VDTTDVSKVVTRMAQLHGCRIIEPISSVTQKTMIIVLPCIVLATTRYRSRSISTFPEHSGCSRTAFILELTSMSCLKVAGAYRQQPFVDLQNHRTHKLGEWQDLVLMPDWNDTISGYAMQTSFLTLLPMLCDYLAWPGVLGEGESQTIDRQTESAPQ
jgi:hypothetical protein